MLTLRYADVNDFTYIAQTQRDPSILDYVSASTKEEFITAINDPDQAYLLAVRPENVPENVRENIPVGFAYLRRLKRPERSIELCRLAISERNKGYGSQFLKLIMTEAFGPLDANRLWLDVFPENDRARQVYQKCGMVEEGTLRDVYFWKGEFRSTIIMSILAREYQAELR